MRRSWKTHDLVDLFNSTARGFLPMRCVTNKNIEGWDDYFSIPLDHAWPDGIPDRDKNNEPQEDMEFKIEKGIPIPSIHKGRATDEFWLDVRKTSAALEIGESFFVPLRDENDKVAAIQTHFTSWARRYLKDKHFVTRKQNVDGKESGLRIWRLE